MPITLNSGKMIMCIHLNSVEMPSLMLDTRVGHTDIKSILGRIGVRVGD